MRTREQLHEARRKIRRERVVSVEETDLRTGLRIVEIAHAIDAACERALSIGTCDYDEVDLLPYVLEKERDVACVTDADWCAGWHTLLDPVLATRQTTQNASNARFSITTCSDEAADAILDRYGTWRYRGQGRDGDNFVFSPAAPQVLQQEYELDIRRLMALQAFTKEFGDAEGMYRHERPRYGGLTVSWAGDDRGWCTEAGGPIPAVYTLVQPENPSFGDVLIRPSGERLVFDDDAWVRFAPAPRYVPPYTDGGGITAL